MKKENYCKWSNPNISDKEWEKMLGENDFEHPTSIIKLLHNASPEELDKIMLDIEELQEENEKERERQIELMKQFLYELGVRHLDDTIEIEEVKEKWKANFCENLTLEEQNACHMDEFLWHAFSYKRVMPVALGDEAKAKFDSIEKHDVYVFSENDEVVYHISAPNELKCYMFRLIYSEDVYFVDSKFSWTFVLPHDYDVIWYSKE